MAYAYDKGFLKFPEEAEVLRKSTVTPRTATLFKKHIGNLWEDLGVLLELSKGDLHNIKTTHVGTRGKGGAVLEIWMDKEGLHATVGRLETAFIELENKGAANKLLDIVREEKRRESAQNGDRSEENQKTLSSPLEERSEKGNLDGESKRVARLENVRRNNLEKLKSQRAEAELGHCQGSERGSPEKMPSGAEEPANASRTRNIDLSESRECLQNVETDQAWTRMEPRVDEPPRRQRNTGSDESLKTMHSLLKEEAKLKEAIEKIILECIAGHKNLEVLRESTEKVRKVKEEFLGASQ